MLRRWRANTRVREGSGCVQCLAVRWRLKVVSARQVAIGAAFSFVNLKLS